MTSLTDLHEMFASSLNHRPAAADMSTMRDFCVELTPDVPSSHRDALLARLGRLRRASDLWMLRMALFNVVARHHGEQVAKARLAALDDKLLPYSQPMPLDPAAPPG